MSNCSKRTVFDLVLLRLITLFICFLWKDLVFAQNFSGEGFPKDFKYQNKPIDPLCIEKLTVNDTAREAAVNIDSCSKHPEYQVLSVDDDLIRKGFIGYEYSYKLPNAPSMQGTSYYRYLGKIDNGHLIYSMQNNGGSGLITAILLVERIGNRLRLIKELDGGDRCNGGIDPSIQVKDKTVAYKASVTPYSAIAFSGAMQDNVNAYDDLANCATCCIGDATFEYNVSSDTNKAKLTSLTLNKDAGKDEVYSQGKLQTCFNSVIRDYISKNKNGKFTADQLKDFAQKFNSACIK